MVVMVDHCCLVVGRGVVTWAERDKGSRRGTRRRAAVGRVVYPVEVVVRGARGVDHVLTSEVVRDGRLLSVTDDQRPGNDS